MLNVNVLGILITLIDGNESCALLNPACTLVGEGPLKNLQPAGSLKITQQTRAAGKFVRQACSVCWWIGLWCSSACFPLYCHCICLCTSCIELKKETKVPFGPLQRVETVSGIKMTFLVFGIEVPLPPVTFQCCQEFRTASKKDVREDDTGGAELLKGSCLLLVTPKTSQNLGGWPRHIPSLKVLLAEGLCHRVRGACRAGKAQRWSRFQSKNYPERCERELAAGTIPLFLSLAP